MLNTQLPVKLLCHREAVASESTAGAAPSAPSTNCGVLEFIAAAARS